MLPGGRSPCGIGVDLVELAGFARKLAVSPTLESRTFTESERALAGAYAASHRARFLGGRFAAKEAVLKALGLGISGGAVLTDVEVASAENGAPVVILRGAALAAAAACGVSDVLVSISHDGGFALAFAVAA